MRAQGGDKEQELRVYRDERALVGALGFALPIILFVGCRILGERAWPSISQYYYSSMGDVLVGVLFAVSAFLFVDGKADRLGWKGPAAALGMLGVALCPCQSPDKFVVGLHYMSAATTFGGLGLVSAVSFSATTSPRLKVLYIASGAVTLVCIAVIAVITLAQWKPPFEHFVFCLEATALWAFSVSWVAKGTEDVVAHNRFVRARSVARQMRA